MRTSSEMMNLILETAKNNQHILAVYMNGSRTNPEIPDDIYKDYDIVYTVDSTKPFLNDKNFAYTFGNPLIVEEPDFLDFGDKEDCDFSNCYTYLMLFDDGNRIDLHIELKEETEKNFLADSLTLPLLDKDGILPKIPAPTDKDYHVKAPTKHKFDACCKDFFWCLNNVAKGLARDEIPYAMEMLNSAEREGLNEMINYYIGSKNDFNVSPGKMGKFYKKFLSPDLYKMYLSTYCDAETENIWRAVFKMCDLFRITAIAVADSQKFAYNIKDDENTLLYLNNIKNHVYEK